MDAMEKSFTGETVIGGVTYRVHAFYMPDSNGGERKVVWVRVARKQVDGSVVWAFLSHRQRSAEAQARRRFAKEIEAV